MGNQQVPSTATKREEVIAKKILKDCIPFLTEINYQAHSYSIFRGMYGLEKIFFAGKNPIYRQPRDTEYVLHKIVDKWFLSKTGVQYRSNALFGTGDEMEALSYGNVYRIFPIGEFSFVWSPNVKDLTYDVLEYINPYEYLPDTSYDEEKKNKELVRLHLNPELINHVHSIMTDAGYQRTNLKQAIESGCEISLHCKAGYYALKYFPDNQIGAGKQLVDKVMGLVSKEKVSSPNDAKPTDFTSPKTQQLINDYEKDIEWAKMILAGNNDSVVAKGVLDNAILNLKKLGIHYV
jgi:hypothetical protein